MMTDTNIRPLAEVKATVLDDDAFRLLAIPFGGPIGSPHSPRGVDLDGEFFSEKSDIKAAWFDVRLVDWHHGTDRTMGRTVIAKAGNLTLDADGWWVDVWLEHGQRRLNLIKQLAERGAQIFGSSESMPGMVKKASTGEILVWPYVRQTLSTSPQNTLSVLRPMKAVLEGATPSAAFWSDIESAMRDLGSDLRLTSGEGEDVAKAGRVLSAVNVTDLEEALAQMPALHKAMKSVEAVLRQIRGRQPQAEVERESTDG